MADIIGRRRWQGCLNDSEFSHTSDCRAIRPSEIEQAILHCKTERMSLMLRSVSESEARFDRTLSESGGEGSARKIRRDGMQSSHSKRRIDPSSAYPSKHSQSLCWVDVFPEEYFGGRLTRLREGEHKEMKKLGSIIVGTDATARCIDRKTNKVHHFGSRTVCPSVSFKGNSGSIRIEVISASAT
jgi:hypothetical protein